ncbi:MAG: DUF3343 domain-containing protein [Christensenellales bacterium]|jgi:hypothetical protein
MDQSYILAAFRSRQQAIAFDLQLRARGMSTKVVASPTEIARGCGVAVLLEPEDLSDVLQMGMHQRYNGFEGFYQRKKEYQGYRWYRLGSANF